MIEEGIKKYLETKIDEKVAYKELRGDSFVVLEKIGSSKKNHLNSSIFAFQSYGPTLYDAALLNEKVKNSIENIIELDIVYGIRLRGDYNFTDTRTKKFRYQAIYEIKHY